MNLSLRHAIYSAILSTEAIASFMFLPSWNGSMITNPYSNLLAAYPHLCYKLRTIPAHEIAYASPQSWVSQETSLPQASWNLHIIVVWNTAAREPYGSTSINTILHGYKILPMTSLKLIGISTTLLATPYVMLGTLRQCLVSRNLKNFRQNTNYQVLPQTCFG